PPDELVLPVFELPELEFVLTCPVLATCHVKLLPPKLSETPFPDTEPAFVSSANVYSGRPSNVTCFVPPGRVMTPSFGISDELATGWVWPFRGVSGTQIDVHEPVQRTMPLAS